MEKHPARVEDGIVRKSGEITPFNAGDAVAATVDVCREMGIPVAPSIKARLGKGAKALLDADFGPDVVVASCVHAIKTGWFGSVESIAQEMVVALSGERVGRDEHKRILAELSHQMDQRESRVWQIMRDEMARRAAPRESQ